MIIHSMTATFGKLEGQTLTLKPGLNVITAPNEWGKSTWCAFLMAMLYGIDTRQRTKQGVLADKERYMPWCGQPMEGSMDITWKGRAITLQRRTRGRVPMGEFRAFETDSGLPVPELTAENCGQVLLGVERSVYQRGGFLKGSDLAVTQDEALSRRLNQLVTTGDDSPVGPALEGKLRELKNKCRYNKSGLIPQTKQELQRCRDQLEQQQVLERQMEALAGEQQQVSQELEALERHRAALTARENQGKLQRVEDARHLEAQAQEALKEAALRCRSLPPPEQAQLGLRRLEELRKEREALDLESAMTPRQTPPEPPRPFEGMTPQEARALAQRDIQEFRTRKESAAGPRRLWLLIAGACGLLLAAAGAVALKGPWKLAAIPAALLALGAILLFVCAQVRRNRNRDALAASLEELRWKYGGQDPTELAQDYARAVEDFEARQSERSRELDRRRRELAQKQTALGLDRRSLEEAVHAWNEWADLRRTAVRAVGYRQSMEALAASLQVELPLQQDALTLSMDETLLQLRKAGEKQTNLRSRMDACLGQSRVLPDRIALEAEAERLQTRLTELETYYTAAAWGLELLHRAQSELQSRFAPQITREAADILSRMTGGRYSKLYLDESLSLSTAGADESTARPLQWRSDGTADQMYLALRLAVSRALSPDAPLVLDDAFIRFDDQRLEEALALLKQEPRQIILFSCQGREHQLEARP